MEQELPASAVVLFVFAGICAATSLSILCYLVIDMLVKWAGRPYRRSN